MIAQMYWSNVGEPIDFVASSTYTGFSIGQDGSNAIAVLQGEPVIFVYTETEWAEGKKFQSWTGKLELFENAKGVLCDDLWTTGKTTRSVRAQIKIKNDIQFVKKNGKPVVLIIVHRPEKLPIAYDDFEVLALQELAIPTYPADNCDICNNGKHSIAKPFKANRKEFMSFVPSVVIT